MSRFTEMTLRWAYVSPPIPFRTSWLFRAWASTTVLPGYRPARFYSLRIVGMTFTLYVPRW